MRYLTYEDYINIGGTLDETAFERIIDRVCGVVDFYTKKRLRGVTEPSQRVCACVRDLCEYLDSNCDQTSRTVTSKSQSAGGVNESESYATKTSEDINAGMYDILLDYLVSETDELGTPLMYKGAQS